MAAIDATIVLISLPGNFSRYQYRSADFATKARNNLLFLICKVARLPSLEKMKGIVKTYLGLLDSGRYDELSPLLSDKVVYQTIIGRAPIVGASNVIQYYKQTRVVGSGVHEVTGIVAEGNMTAVLLRMKGVLKDGSKIEFEAVDLFTFEGDKIAIIRTFTDLPPAVLG